MFYRNEINPDTVIPSRMYYPWTELEEYLPDGGMWSIPAADSRAQFVEDTRKLMVDTDAFREAMRRALWEWPKSCAVALSTAGLNRKAWLGHAGCYLATGSPEETTRLGWHALTDGEQRDANSAALEVIGEWLRGFTPVQTALFVVNHA